MLDIPELWATALESGEYKQGKYALNRFGCFCCLGVLCDLAIKHGVSVKVEEQSTRVTYDGLVGVLPASVVSWAKLQSHVGEFQSVGGRSLLRLNDTGTSFKDIAAIIRSKPEGLFYAFQVS